MLACARQKKWRVWNVVVMCKMEEETKEFPESADGVGSDRKC
jgi:hypothetical protein